MAEKTKKRKRRGKKVMRLYHMEDSKMFEFANDCNGRLEDNLPAFEAYDGTFNAAFVTEYAGKIETAMGLPADNTTRAVQKGSKEVVKKAMSDCKDCFQTVKRFVKRAFPKSRGMEKEFGFDKYKRVQQSTVYFPGFMDEVYDSAVEYKTQLNAVNFSDAMIEEIHIKQQALTESIFSHSQKKHSRPSKNQDRIKVLNEIYSIAADICKSGQLIFRKNYAMRKMFVIYPGQKRKKKTEEQKTEGTS